MVEVSTCLLHGIQSILYNSLTASIDPHNKIVFLLPKQCFVVITLEYCTREGQIPLT